MKIFKHSPRFELEKNRTNPIKTTKQRSKKVARLYGTGSQLTSGPQLCCERRFIAAKTYCTRLFVASVAATTSCTPFLSHLLPPQYLAQNLFLSPFLLPQILAHNFCRLCGSAEEFGVQASFTLKQELSYVLWC